MLTVGNSVQVIDYAAFASCEYLTDVYYAGTESQWNAIDIGDDAIYLLQHILMPELFPL